MMKSSETVENKIDNAARDVLMLSRNTLIVNLRFLDMAMSMLKWFPMNSGTYTIDGEQFGYNPRFVLKSFMEENERPARDYLHVMLHCIFSHMFIGTLVDKDLWDLSCDIAVESTISDLGLKATESNRTINQIHEISELKKHLNMLTAEKIYRYYLDKKMSAAQIAVVRKLFVVDDHRCWYDKKKPAEKQGDDGTNNNKPGVNNKGGNNNQAGDQGEGLGSQTGKTQNELMQEWKNISEKIQQDLETFSKAQGDTAGGMMQNLNAVNREKYDYTSFLKKFAVLGEAMVINDDEFDYIFYTYGLQLYKNVPLIEPLEYKEVKRIKEFVIAIDTSGSTSGELVQRFVQKTYNVLKSTESFFSKINIHIIQCDAAIQEHVKITSQEEFDDYLNSMTIHGLGGTDFRPVFDFVDSLVEAKECTNLKGLIYFTDGWGTFPSHKPAYDSAFVFLNNDYFNPEVPPWAIKLVLQDDEI